MYDFFVAIILLFVIDLFWLLGYAGNAYQKMIFKIQGSSMRINMFYGFIVYILMAILVVNYGLSFSKTEFNYIRPFILGLCVYGVYDFTAGAVIKNWDIRLALMDTLWGGLLFTFVSYVMWRFIH